MAQPSPLHNVKRHPGDPLGYSLLKQPIEPLGLTVKLIQSLIFAVPLRYGTTPSNNPPRQLGNTPSGQYNMGLAETSDKEFVSGGLYPFLVSNYVTRTGCA